MSEKIIGVYKISNAEDGRYYIGHSKNINTRFTTHKSNLKRGKHINIFLQRAYNKYGVYKFKFEIIHKFDTVEEAKDKEDEYLKNMEIRDEVYNLNYNNSGGDIISTHPNKEEIIKRMANTIRNNNSKLTSDELKAKFGKFGEKNGMYGKTHTKEARKILSKTHKGNTYRVGFKCSEETCNKMSEIAKQRTGEKNPFFGKTHSEESRKKISENNKGKKGRGMIKVIVDDVEYESITDAGKQLGLNITVVLWRLKSKNSNFDNYKYSENNTQEVYEMNKQTKIRKERKKPTTERKKHSEESKRKMSESQKGHIVLNGTKLIIDNVIYNSIREATVKLNLNKNTITKRVKSNDPKFENYKYAEDKKEIIPKNGIKVKIDDIVYNSMSEAGIKLNLDKTTIARRVKSDKSIFKNYKYA